MKPQPPVNNTLANRYLPDLNYNGGTAKSNFPAQRRSELVQQKTAVTILGPSRTVTESRTMSAASNIHPARPQCLFQHLLGL